MGFFCCFFFFFFFADLPIAVKHEWYGYNDTEDKIYMHIYLKGKLIELMLNLDDSY